METIFMNTENSKTSEPHRFKLNSTDKRNLNPPPPPSPPKKNKKKHDFSQFEHLLHLEKH